MPENIPAPAGASILWALQSRRHIYGGTVPAATVARRRQANKAAGRSRRINRRGGK